MRKLLLHTIVYIVSFTFFLPLFLAMFLMKKEPSTFWSRYIDLHLNFIDWVWSGYNNQNKEDDNKKKVSKYPELPRTVSRMLSRVGYDKLLDEVNKTILEKEYSSTQEYWRLFREELINQNKEDE